MCAKRNVNDAIHGEICFIAASKGHKNGIKWNHLFIVQSDVFPPSADVQEHKIPI